MKTSQIRPTLLALVSSAVLITACGTPDDTIPAAETDRIPNAFVGAVDDDLFIAVAFDELDVDDADVTAYLCNGDDVVIWLSGEMAAGEATLSTEAAQVAFTKTDERASGTVVVGDKAPKSFTADLASGNAGLYRLEEATEEGTSVAGWIVLEDGRQRGGLDGKGNDVFLTF